MLEHDEHRSTEAQGEGQKARAGEPGGVGHGAEPALSGENDLMIKRRRDQQADAQKHALETGALHGLTGGRNVPEEVLENSLEEESEQNLRPQYQEAGFIERGLELPVLIHLASRNAMTWLGPGSTSVFL